MEKLLLLMVAVPFWIGFSSDRPEPEPVEAEVLFSFVDEQIVESSGLVARQGLVVTVNDSGDANRVFTVDAATGGTVGVTTWTGDADDIEALAPAGDGAVWVGDIGDNLGRRDGIRVTRVPFGPGDHEAPAPTYELAYPDGPHDAETLLVHPQTGRIYVVSKEFIGRVYAAPERLDDGATNQLRAVDEVLGIATDGAFFPDGRHLVIRSYTQAAVYTWPDLDRVALLDLPSQPQGEGIAVTEAGEVLLSSEGAESEVLQLELPEELQEQVAAPEGASPAPDDASSQPTAPGDEATGAAAEEAVPVQREPDRPWWPWALGGITGVVIIVVLLRALRPR